MRSAFKAADFDAFCQYVKEQGKKETTIVYLDVETLQMVAVLDAGSVEAPGWRRNKAIWALTPTPEWVDWRTMSDERVLLIQGEFADFLEEHMDEIQEPPAARIIEAVNKFRAKKMAHFENEIDEASGAVNLVISEEIHATSSTGQKGAAVKFPAKMTIGVQPFRGAKRYACEVRILHRVQEGRVLFGIKMPRAERIWRDAAEDLAESIKDELSEYRCYLGSE